MTPSKPLTKPLQKAVDWLAAHGGSGAIDCYGRVLAGGELATHIDSTIWLRLVARGLVRGEGGRLALVSGESMPIHVETFPAVRRIGKEPPAHTRCDTQAKPRGGAQ